MVEGRRARTHRDVPAMRRGDKCGWVTSVWEAGVEQQSCRFDAPPLRKRKRRLQADPAGQGFTEAANKNTPSWPVGRENLELFLASAAGKGSQGGRLGSQEAGTPRGGYKVLRAGAGVGGRDGTDCGAQPTSHHTTESGSRKVN